MASSDLQSLAIEMDISDIARGTSEYDEFLAQFSEDVATAVDADPELVKVENVRVEGPTTPVHVDFRLLDKGGRKILDDKVQLLHKQACDKTSQLLKGKVTQGLVQPKSSLVVELPSINEIGTFFSGFSSGSKPTAAEILDERGPQGLDEYLTEHPDRAPCIQDEMRDSPSVAPRSS